jgi:hypothetical protein
VLLGADGLSQQPGRRGRHNDTGTLQCAGQTPRLATRHVDSRGRRVPYLTRARHVRVRHVTFFSLMDKDRELASKYYHSTHVSVSPRITQVAVTQ